MKETVFIIGDSIIKKVNEYHHKFLVTVRPFTTAKTTDMYDHLKPSLQDFNPGLFIIHVGTNNLPLNKTSNEIVEEILNFAESVAKSSSNIIISNIITREDDYKNKAHEVNKILKEMCGTERIPLIRNNNISSKRHLNMSRIHLNDTGISVIVRNFKTFLTNFKRKIE